MNFTIRDNIVVRVPEDDDYSKDSYKDAETFLLLPILINVFLITANLLASWGGITCNHMFLIPWLASYFSYILFAFGLLLYMVIVLHQVWFKIVIFLIVSPILIIAIVFWLTVLEFYFIVKINKSQSKIEKNVSTSFRYPTITSSRIKSQNPSLPPPPPLPPNNQDFNLLVKKKPSLLERHRPLFKRNISKSNYNHRSYRRLGQASSLPISMFIFSSRSPNSKSHSKPLVPQSQIQSWKVRIWTWADTKILWATIVHSKPSPKFLFPNYPCSQMGSLYFMSTNRWQMGLSISTVV